MRALVYNHPYRHHRNHRDHNNGEERECRYSPSVNISETEDNFKVELAVPGFSKKEIKIDLEKDMLKIYSEREMENGANGYRVRQFGGHNFAKSFVLPETVDNENIKADYKNGVLTLVLPKKEEVRVKKQIQVS
jgi:HSP20 family protein